MECIVIWIWNFERFISFQLLYILEFLPDSYVSFFFILIVIKNRWEVESSKWNREMQRIELFKL